MRRLIAAVALGVALLAPNAGLLAEEAKGPSPAQRKAALALANEGLELYEAGDHAAAIQRFESAERIIHAPPHMLFIARARAHQLELLEAVRVYEGIVAEQLPDDAPKQFTNAQQTARSELASLREEIPAVRITLRGAEPHVVQVRIDGQPIEAATLAGPILLDPGEHAIVAQAPGRPPLSRSVGLERAGGAQLVELTFEPSTPPSPPPTPQPDDEGAAASSVVGPVVVLALGAAALVVGAITGGLALDDASELEDQCPTRQCSTEHQPLYDSAETLGNVCTAGLVVGGAGVLAGALWLALLPSEDAQPAPEGVSISLDIAPLGLGVRGTF